MADTSNLLNNSGIVRYEKLHVYRNYFFIRKIYPTKIEIAFLYKDVASHTY